MAARASRDEGNHRQVYVPVAPDFQLCSGVAPAVIPRVSQRTRTSTPERAASTWPPRRPCYPTRRPRRSRRGRRNRHPRQPAAATTSDRSRQRSAVSPACGAVLRCTAPPRTEAPAPRRSFPARCLRGCARSAARQLRVRLGQVRAGCRRATRARRRGPRRARPRDRSVFAQAPRNDAPAASTRIPVPSDSVDPNGRCASTRFGHH